MDTKVSALIHDNLGNLLLQKRDEEPELGKWVPFGGSIEKGETPEQALIRELNEELGYCVKQLRHLKNYSFGEVRQIMYVLVEPVNMSQIHLMEGAEMRFFNQDELKDIDIGFNYAEIIYDYLKGS